MLLVAMEMTRATGLLKTEKNSKCKNRKHRFLSSRDANNVFFSCGIDKPRDYDYCPIGYLGSIYSSNLILIFFS